MSSRIKEIYSFVGHGQGFADFGVLGYSCSLSGVSRFEVEGLRFHGVRALVC